MGFVQKPSLREEEASASCEEVGFTRQPSQPVVVRKLRQISALLREQLQNVRQVEQDGTFSTTEADAERAHIEAEKTAVKAEYFTSLRITSYMVTSCHPHFCVQSR